MGKIKSLCHECINYIRILETSLVLELDISQDDARGILYEAFGISIINLYENCFSLDLENRASINEIIEFLENNKYYEKGL